jgi:MoaA/NifB/PqqE/SkfB family radical SAM enzyme
MYEKVIIETSALCDLRCVMCPTLHYDQTMKGMMSEAVFDAVTADVASGMTAVLTGWGEPMLDKDIISRIRACSSRGLTTYIASHAMHIGRGRAEELLDAGLDGMTVSFDGGNKAGYESVRVNSDFDRVVGNMRGLVALKRERKPDFILDATYVLMKRNIGEFDDFLSLMRDVGVDMVTVTPKYLEYSFGGLLFDRLPWDEMLRAVEAGRRRAESLGLKFRTYCVDEPRPKDNCLADAVRTPFVSYSGGVSPCCNLGHPTPRMPMKGLSMPKRNVLTMFGNVLETPLSDIWNLPVYENFRNTLKKGQAPAPCRGCALLPGE